MRKPRIEEKTRLRLSPFGLGGTVVADHRQNWVRKSDFLKLLDICTGELAMNYLDSAPSYELSEQVIGQWLRKKGARFRDQIVVGSKVNCAYGKGRVLEGLTPKRIRQELDSSLLKLKLDNLDLYWMHSPDATTPLKKTLSAFDALIKEGKLRHYGLCNVTTKELMKIVGVCNENGFVLPTAVQNQFNLLTWPHQLGVAKHCRTLNIGFIAFSPLAGGFLTGQYSWGIRPPVGSRWRALSARGAPLPYDRKFQFDAVNELRTEAKRRHLSCAEIALAWCRNHDYVDTTIVGPRKLSHLKAVRNAMKLELRKNDQKKLQQIIWTNPSLEAPCLQLD